MGDFNAKHSSWGCDVDTRRGITFNRHIQRSGYRILAPPTPTRYGHDSASTLDLAISTNVDWPCTATSISELSSDHNPVTLQKQIKKIVLKHEQKQWDESLACLEAEDGSLWKAARNSRKKAQPVPALKGPAKIAYSDADKSEVIADSLQNQFKLNDITNDTDRAITHVVHTYLNNENNFTNIPPTPPPLPSEIIEHIDKVKINKAAGIDRTTNRMLKHLPLVPIFELTNIIHNIIKIGYFPIVWKTATVVPILKPGKDPTQAESFRPIALLSILGKVAEKIILNRLYHHVVQNNILIPEQHGFRPDLSTTHQLLRVVETIKSGFKNKKSTGTEECGILFTKTARIKAASILRSTLIGFISDLSREMNLSGQDEKVLPGVARSCGSNKTAQHVHTARATIDLLKDTFGDRLISRFGPVNWPQDHVI
ncbi:RNA-directed DNA polymerase from mobile element jockey [Trichonephila clavipes]|nr:RNA-directed DNA polymerase from mobile element jockey [Trichonephila clavipes]